MKTSLIAFLAQLFVRALHATLRVRHVNAENLTSRKQSILAFWHDHMLLMLHSKFPRPIVVMSSASRDGDIAVRTYAYYGVSTVRGSSTRGGTQALRQLIRVARDGFSVVFTPDGPKGPPRMAKEGVVFFAQATGLPIVPIAFAAKKKSCCTPGTA